VCPCVKPFASFSKIVFRSNLASISKISFQIFSKNFGLFKSGLLAVAIFQIFISSKLAYGFCSKSFVSNLLRFLKSASRFSVKVLASLG